MMQLAGHEYVKQIRSYCDYLEEHFINIEKAFNEVYSKCKHMSFFANDFNYHTLYTQVKYHDLSKFSSEEFIPYVNKFYLPQAIPVNDKPHEFELAWVHHYNSNTHHWESASTAIDVFHMVIDWTAMGYKFGDTAEEYYNSNYSKILLKPDLIPLLGQIFQALKEQS